MMVYHEGASWFASFTCTVVSIVCKGGVGSLDEVGSEMLPKLLLLFLATSHMPVNLSLRELSQCQCHIKMCKVIGCCFIPNSKRHECGAERFFAALTC